MSEAETSSKFYYATPGCEGLLQQLQHLLRFGEGLPVVQAGLGAGKTAMANELAARLHDVPFLVSLKCDVDQAISETLGAIVQGFGIHEDEQGNAGESLASLRQFAAQLVNNKQLAVLILDDAHQLDSQSLGAVVSLLQGNNLPGYGLHLVFFAAPGLVERVDELGLIDAPVYDFEIPLFSPSELSSFLKKKYSGGSASFSANLVQQIWSQSLGSPGVALQLSLNALEEGEGRNEALETLSKIPKGHMLALAVLVAVLLWVALAREPDNESHLAVEGEADTRTVVLSPETDKHLKTEEKADLTKTPDSSEDVVTATRVDKNDAKVELQEPASQTPPQNSRNQNETDEEPGNVSFAPARSSSIISEKAENESANTSIVKKPDAVPEVKIKNQRPAASSPGRQASPQATQTPPTPSGMTANELFLMDQAPDTYTLQIIAASRKDALLKYMGNQANKNDLYLYQGLREGRAWFVVVTGVFTSRQEALAAIQGLPQEQQKGGPWPRQLKDIHYEIVANRSK